MSIRTIKLPYTNNSLTDKEIIKSYCKNYTNVLRFTYNRIQDYQKENNSKPSTQYLTSKQKEMNNVFIDSHFKNSAIFEAKSKSKVEKVIFGGKKNFLDRVNGKISNEEWKELSIQPLCSVGEAGKKGNRKFRIIDENHILFQSCRDTKIVLNLPKLRKNLKRDILKLRELQNSKSIPITYKLDSNFIYISFENNELQKEESSKKIKDRVFSIDLNPNYIGWAVVDWKNSDKYEIIDSGVISNKVLNDKDFNLKNKGISSNDTLRIRINNKRNFENIDSANFLFEKALHYKCEIFSIENLNIKSSDKEKGKKFNKLCNNLWNRNLLVNQLRKRCELMKIQFLEVQSNFSSFEGNLVYRETNLPDMCLSAIEIGRRGYEFYHQYIVKDKPNQKNIIFNTSPKSKEKIIQSLEELNFFDAFESISDLYYKLKTLKMKYRVPLENSCLKEVFSKKHIKSQVFLYT